MKSKNHQIIEAAKRIYTLGLNRGSSGNLSCRAEKKGFLITTSGSSFENLLEENIVTMSNDGKVIDGENPSSEWRIHMDLYKARPDFDAIVHTHSKYASVLACLRKELPSFHYMVAIAGGENVRCCPYALFGTKELSENVIESMVDRRACLMSNHGLVVGSSSLSNAIYIADEVESLCEQYVQALSTGKVHLLTSSQMGKVLKKFKNYGNLRINKNAKPKYDS